MTTKSTLTAQPSLFSNETAKAPPFRLQYFGLSLKKDVKGQLVGGHFNALPKQARSWCFVASGFGVVEIPIRRRIHTLFQTDRNTCASGRSAVLQFALATATWTGAHHAHQSAPVSAVALLIVPRKASSL